jgi:hypothetical protein
MAFDEFEVKVEKLSFTNVWCNNKNEGVVWKRICTCVLFQWQMVEEPYAFCKFILLKYEER